MFDLGRILRFLGRLLMDYFAWIVVIYGLAALTEVLTHLDLLPEFLFTPEFWLTSGLNLFPAGAVTLITIWLAGRFLYSVYGLGSWRDGVAFVMRSRFGQPGFGPWMKVDSGKITLNADGVLARIGGPGSLIIYNDSAVVLERRGVLTRVLGPGFPKIEAFEKIYDIVDLRPKRWVYTVSAMTKEGIPINWDAEVHYQIADGEKESTEENPYPFSEESVFRAATCKWRREAGRDQDMDWEGRIVIGETEGILRSILARYPLDQLIGTTEVEEQAAREAVQEELERRLRRAVTPALGAKILRVKLDNLKVDDAITREWITFWKARWERELAGRSVEGDARSVYMYETAKAEAQMQFIVTIGRALQELEASPGVTPRIILMRLFSALDRARLAASARVFVPGQALEALDTIKDLLEGGSDSNQQQ
jgi:hypothetical protein